MGASVKDTFADAEKACDSAPSGPLILNAVQVEAIYNIEERYMPEISRALAIMSDEQRRAVFDLIRAFQRSG